MDEIKQTMSIDIAQSMDALNKLDRGFSKLETRLGDLTNAFKSFNSNSAAKSIGSAFQSSFSQATQTTERLTVSFGLMSRIITTQFIVRSLSQIRRTFEQVTDEAIEFQTKLAEIQTISPGSNLGTLSGQVRQLSDSFNIELLDVAAAKYEAISNGFSSAAQQSDVLSASLKFSKTALTDAGKSLDLISGILNSFGLNADRSETIAAKLFKTIELGKVTGPELANSLGRVAPTAAQLGVSLDEVLSQFATLTIGGVNANEAATQISATLSALVKPSNAASDAFDQLGFSSAETAIQTLSLQGTIKALIGTTDGSAESIARIFPNVRALRDVLRVAPNDATLGRFLREIQEIDTNKFNQILGTRLATDAERVTSEVNKLKNALTVDLGQALLSDAAGFVRLTGGVDGFISATKTLAPVLETGIGLLGVYSIAALKGATANEKFAASFKGISAGLLLGAGAAAAGSLIGNRLLDVVQAPEKEFDELARTSIENLRRNESERLSALESSDARRLDSTLKSVQNLNKAYLADVDNAEAAAKALVRNADRTTNDILQSREKLTEGLQRAAERSRDLQRDSVARVADLGQLSDDRAFDRFARRLPDIKQAFAIGQRAVELADRAAAGLARASQLGDDVGINHALQLFDRAQRAGDVADQIAQRTGNRGLEVQAANALESVTKRQIEAEKQLQAIQTQRQAGLNAFNSKQLAALDAVREQADIIRRNSNILGTDGKLLPDDQIAKQRQAIEAALTKIRNSGLSAADLREADRLGLGQQARDFNLKLSQQALSLNFDVTGGIDRLQSRIQASFDRFKVRIGFDTDALGDLLGKQFRSPEQVARGIDELKNKAGELRKAFAQIGVDDANTKRLQTELLGIAAAVDSTGRGALRSLVGPIGANNEQLQLVTDLRLQLEGLAKSGAISEAQITAFFDKVARLKNEALSGTVAKNVGLAIDLNELSRAVLLLQELRAAQQSIGANPALQDGASRSLEALERTIRTLETANPATAFQSAASSIERGSISAERLADAFQRAADNAERLSGARPQGFATGGRVDYFASGGAARGTDTIPAMLSRDETVINARSSRRFFSQLQSIQAGNAPTMQSAGSVTNAGIVGDVNINVTNSGGQLSGKSIADAINREIRRGVVNLR